MTKKYSDSEKKDKKAALKEDNRTNLKNTIHEFMNGEKYKIFLTRCLNFTLTL